MTFSFRSILIPIAILATLLPSTLNSADIYISSR